MCRDHHDMQILFRSRGVALSLLEGRGTSCVMFLIESRCR
jgi:hypothetical protein